MSETPEGSTSNLFDPNEHTVEEVQAHLDGADEDEFNRVVDLEEEGKNRKGVMEYTPKAEAASDDGEEEAADEGEEKSYAMTDEEIVEAIRESGVAPPSSSLNEQIYLEFKGSGKSPTLDALKEGQE